MQNLIDEISELVYVVDMENYHLLYINETGRQLFQLEKEPRQKCYKALHHRETPCEFCNNDKLEKDRFYTWECYNKVTKHYYLLKDKKIMWQGKEVKLEIALNITKQIEQRQSLQKALDIEELLLDCVKAIYQMEDIAKAIEYMLEKVGRFFYSTCAYVLSLEIKDLKAEKDYEWFEKKETSIKKKRKILLPFLKRCFESTALADIVPFYSIWDTENIEIKKSFPEIYAFLQNEDISYLIVAPLKLNNKLFGFIIIENPSLELQNRVNTILEPLAYFFASSIERTQTNEILKRYSFEDGLTGLNNRNKFILDLDRIIFDKIKEIGVIFLDVNGLKKINDNLGHSYGDKVLIQVANMIRQIFSQDNVYRIGGDEYVIICCEIERDELIDKAKKLEKRFEEEHCSVSIGYIWREEVTDINAMITEADARMYEDKKRYYKI